MILRLRIFSLIISIFFFYTILYLVKKRKLREEFAVFWLGIGSVIVFVSFWERGLLLLTNLIGAKTIVSTIFFFGILFLLVVSLFFSIKISDLTEKIKKLTQKIAVDDYPNNKEKEW